MTRLWSSWLQVAPGEVQAGYEEQFLCQKSGDAVAQLHREGAGGGVTIPGGVQELQRRGSEGRGQWAWWGGLGLDLGI